MITCNNTLTGRFLARVVAARPARFVFESFIAVDEASGILIRFAGCPDPVRRRASVVPGGVAGRQRRLVQSKPVIVRSQLGSVVIIAQNAYKD